MTYFHKRRAIAGGLAIAGSSLGGVIFPILVVHLLPKVGFGWTMRICAFLILALLFVTNLTISSNIQHTLKPFQLSQYLGPLRETNFLLMCIGSFLLYCTSNPVPFQSNQNGADICDRGDVHSAKLYRHLSYSRQYVSVYGIQPDPHPQWRQVGEVPFLLSFPLLFFLKFRQH